MICKTKAFRLFGAAVAALTALSMLTGCGGKTGSNTDSSADASKAAEDSSKASLAATGLYQPKDGEHRMTDLLNEIQSTGKVAFLYGTGENKTMAFSYGKETDQYVILDYAWLTHSINPMTQIGGDLDMMCYRLIQKDGDKYSGYWIEPDQKLYGYSMATVTDNGIDKPTATFYESTNVNSEYLTGIPDCLTPEYWDFISSGKEAINGIDYYRETYNYYTNTQHFMFNVLFDGVGDMAYIGAAESDETRSLMDTTLTENEYALKSLFQEPSSNIYLGRGTAPSSLIHPSYKQYLAICIKPEFDSSLYRLDEYETITDTFEFKERLISDNYDAIKEALGLDFDF